MSERDRGGSFKAVTYAFFGVVAVLLLMALWDLASKSAEYSHSAIYYADQNSKETQDQIRESCVSAPVLAECVSKIVESSNDTNRAKHDLAAQENMALWAGAMFWATVVTVMIGAIGVYYVRDTLLETRRIGQAQVRAYVQVGTVEAQYITEDGSHFLRTFIDFENTGQSPTRNLVWWIDHKNSGFKEAGEFILGSSAVTAATTIGAGRSTKDVSYLIPTAKIPKGFNSRIEPITVFGAVTYGDVFNADAAHITEFSFELLRGRIANKTHEGIKVDVYTGVVSIDRAT